MKQRWMIGAALLLLIAVAAADVILVLGQPLAPKFAWMFP
jgi:hypothetical protein